MEGQSPTGQLDAGSTSTTERLGSQEGGEGWIGCSRAREADFCIYLRGELLDASLGQFTHPCPLSPQVGFHSEFEARTCNVCSLRYMEMAASAGEVDVDKRQNPDLWTMGHVRSRPEPSNGDRRWDMAPPRARGCVEPGHTAAPLDTIKYQT